MSKVRIVTDSTADIPVELIKELNIEIVPLKVIFGEESYKDWVELKPADFFTKLKSSDKLPTTSQPSPVEFYEVYNRLNQAGYSILSVHISSDLSGTFQSANLGKEMVPGADIEISDSRLVSMALGLIVIEAARAAKAGKSKEEIIELIEELKNKIKLYIVVDTLEYLQKGGRIGKASSMLGALLNIKPIITISEGIVTPVTKIRSKGKAIEKVLEMMKEDIHEKQSINYAIVYSDDIISVNNLKEKINNQFTVKESFLSEIGSVIGTHGGPGLVAVIYYPIGE